MMINMKLSGMNQHIRDLQWQLKAKLILFVSYRRPEMLKSPD